MTSKYKLVPIEPTDEMIRAAENVEWANGSGLTLSWVVAPKVYKAMLEASPAQDSEPVAQILTDKDVYAWTSSDGNHIEWRRGALVELGYKDDEILPLYTHPPADKAERIEPAKQIKIWYLNDNHTFAPLTLDFDESFLIVKEQWAKGYTSGMLCFGDYKPDGVKEIHCHYYDLDKFVKEMRETYEALKAME